MTLSRSLHGVLAAVACALLQASAAIAAPTSTTPSGEDTPLRLDAATASEHAAGGGGGIVRTIVGLAVVIGVIFGLHWILKQVKSSRETRSSGGGLDTISSLQLGPGRALHLVRSGTEIVLVGTAEHGVTPIRVYSELEALALGLLDDEDERAAAGAGDAVRDDRKRGTPLNAGPGSPPAVKDLVRTLQRWTVRR